MKTKATQNQNVLVFVEHVFKNSNLREYSSVQTPLSIIPQYIFHK